MFSSECISKWACAHHVGGVTGPQVNSFLAQSRQQVDTCREETHPLSTIEPLWTWRQRGRRPDDDLWSGQSSASAPTGPGAGSCSVRTRKSAGSGTTTATGRLARSARGDTARPRTPPARGRPRGSGRAAPWTGSPAANRK